MSDTNTIDRACRRCGIPGHYGQRDGCSKTYLAAKMVLEGRASITQAARRLGVGKASVSKRLIKLGHRTYRAKGSGKVSS